jgi:hypothetical protein
MGTLHTTTTTTTTSATRRLWTTLGVLLLVCGLLCHLIAARAIGGSYVAYRDHVLGFVLISAVAGALIAGLGWRFWKRRLDISLLILGVVNAVMGILVYVQRFHVHG